MERRKFVIGLGSLAAGGAAATGTGAFTAAEITGRQADIEVNGDDAALIQMVPGHDASVAGEASTVTSNRVWLNNGQLAISFDDGAGTGINPESVYQVGAIGSDAESALSTLPNRPAQSDVLYSDGGTDADPAFVLRNESDRSHNVEIEWTGDSPRDSDNGDFDATEVGAAFVSDSEGVDAGGNPDKAGFVLGLDDSSFGTARFELESGDEVGLSLIAAVGDIDPSETQGWIGSLEVRAGETVNEVVEEDPNDDTNTTNTST